MDKEHILSKQYKKGCKQYYRKLQKEEERLRKLKEKQQFKVGNEVTLLDRIYDMLEILGLVVIVLALIALTFR